MANKKHNKKRNTAFLFEVLTRELTRTSIKEEKERRNKVIELLKEYFSSGSVLYKDLELYNSIQPEQNFYLTREQALQAINNVKQERNKLNHKEIFQKQGALIGKINKELSPSIFQTFVPNYKNLASIAQIFSKNTKTKDKVMLETQLVDVLVEKKEKEPEGLDSFELKTFIKKFNEKYSSSSLLKEQKELLNKYMLSFMENKVDYNVFLNEELGRLKEMLASSEQKIKEIKEDEEMQHKVREVTSLLESYKKKNTEEINLEEVMNIQQLVYEMYEDKGEEDDASSN